MLNGNFQILAVSVLSWLPLAKLSPQAQRIPVPCTCSLSPSAFQSEQGHGSWEQQHGLGGLDQGRSRTSQFRSSRRSKMRAPLQVKARQLPPVAIGRY